MVDLTSRQKRDALLALAKKRQADRLPPHLSLGWFHDGYYECDFVSPWTISAHNVNAGLMLFGQDWSSSERLCRRPDEEQRSLGQIWDLPTNKRLRCLLQRHLNLEFKDIYATNLFPFIKNGRLSAPIPTPDLERCALKYAIPQIEIVDPAIVVCLGKQTFDSIRNALDQPAIPWHTACQTTQHTMLGSVEVCAVPHAGNLGVRNAGGMERVHQIWAAVATRYRALTGGE